MALVVEAMTFGSVCVMYVGALCDVYSSLALLALSH